MTKQEAIKVLLIEDDQFLAKMYTTKLNMEDIAVHLAPDGQEGINLAKAEKPDIILLDIILPKMDGWQVLEALKADAKTKSIPVLLLTNLGQQEDIEKGLKLGADEYLIKAHFTPSEVLDKIKSILNKK